MVPWARWREPLAVLLLTALALMLVVRAFALGLAIESGNAGGLLGSIPGGDDLLVLVTAGAVLWCATPVAPGPQDATGAAVVEESAPSAHARPIALAGAVIVGLTVLGWLVLSMVNVVTLLTWPTPDVGFAMLVIEGLLRLVLPAAALLAVISAVRRTAPTRRHAASAERPALPASATESADEREDTGAPQRLPAAWQADEATGAVWLTADDAAQGRPGLSWTDPQSAGRTAGGWALPPGPAAESESGVGGEKSEQGTGIERDADVPPSPGPPDVSGPPGPLAGPGATRPAAEDDDLR